MRRALIIGINDYSTAPLNGCVEDANRIEKLLAKNADDSPNFTCRKLITPRDRVSRASLRQAVTELFASEADVALFYFSGHGFENDFGGYLVTQDAERADEGVKMMDIIECANNASNRIKEAVLILDCCHSGACANFSLTKDMAVLRQGISVLTASRSTEAAIEKGGAGVFTSLVSDALAGGAADVIGHVTAASTYAYVDQVLGAWDQRPMFKAHVSKLLPLRICRPVVEPGLLRQLPEVFTTPNLELVLDSSFEPTAEPRNAKNERTFSLLQRYRAARLVEPIGEEHMYYAALNGAACKLTPLGQFYWQLAKNGKV